MVTTTTNKEIVKIISFSQFIHHIDGSIKYYILRFLWMIRIIIVFTPQFGYLQPDEFFQFTEPVAGNVLNVEAYYPWEFNTTFPLRNMLFPQLISSPWFYFVKALENGKGLEMANIKPYLLLIGPRIVITVLSFFIDYFIFCLLARIYSNQHNPAKRSSQILHHLLLHGSWYSVMTYYTHTFSNTIELILFSYLLVIIFSSYDSIIDNVYLKLGLLLSIGFFNRPTFALYAMIPMLYWLVTFSPERRQHFKAMAILDRIRLTFHNGLNVLKYILVGSLFMISIDTIFHRNISDLVIDLNELRCLSTFSKFIETPTECLIKLYKVISDYIVLTPLNFAIYNLQTKNLKNHGLHPFYFHILVSIPFLFLLLALPFFYDLIFKCYRRHWRETKNDIFLVLFITLIFTIIGFSAIPHQEPRFLLPLSVIMFTLYGDDSFSLSNNVRKILFTLWIIINVTLTIFYGYIHQAGVVRSIFYIKPNINELLVNKQMDADLFFVRMYLPPRHLLSLPTMGKRVTVHDLAIDNFPEQFQKQLTLRINQRTKNNEMNRSQFIVILPSALNDIFNQTMSKHFCNFQPQLIESLFPHFTGEELSDSLRILFNPNVNDDDRMIDRLWKAFSMNIWYLNPVF